MPISLQRIPETASNTIGPNQHANDIISFTRQETCLAWHSHCSASFDSLVPGRMPGCFVFWVSRKGLDLALVLDGILYVYVYLLGLGVLVLGGIVGVVQWVWGVSGMLYLH
ncbi:unnamed protein product [Aspergillus oryzae]|uniref:Unnamed protein product n=1 Tax=Aspergillus oryzae var. brunneus TaxID=332754 RepID=A0ABQ6L6S7_ASPOZ|nr:unnamed protein product [Aspergillus oryzae]GMF85796.1 unnamed protein product [Aspergillus oryzae]GMG01274.1 unnamed protein product [Aspergillus oryzae]GMG51770.1 unnamed protein product [Aspergillus oryzae var. brunneus]